MATATTSIEWTDRTWNPVRGCSVISPGCVNCYAMKQAHRFSGPGKAYEGLTKQTSAGPQWTGVVRTVEDALLEPLSWRKPARVFVSMSDLFHEAVPDAFIDQVFAVMVVAHHHTFQILTKRPERMREYMSFTRGAGNVLARVLAAARALPKPKWWQAQESVGWPYRNVWLGVSVENQHFADERIPLLLQTPAAVRFISAEPLLGPVDLGEYGWLSGCDACCNGDRCPGPPECMRFERRSCVVCKGTARGNNIDWVIVGGESGNGARPFHLEWAEAIISQCAAAGVAAFMKQAGQNAFLCGHQVEGLSGKGGVLEELPPALRVRQVPPAAAV